MDPKERFVPRGRRVTRIFLAAVAAVTLLAVSMPGAALGVARSWMSTTTAVTSTVAAGWSNPLLLS